MKRFLDATAFLILGVIIAAILIGFGYTVVPEPKALGVLLLISLMGAVTWAICRVMDYLS